MRAPRASGRDTLCLALGDELGAPRVEARGQREKQMYKSDLGPGQEIMLRRTDFVVKRRGWG